MDTAGGDNPAYDFARYATSCAFKRKVTLCITAVVLFCFSLLVLVVISPVYEGTAALVFRPSNADLSKETSVTATSQKTVISTLAEVADSDSVLEQAISVVGLAALNESSVTRESFVQKLRGVLITGDNNSPEIEPSMEKRVLPKIRHDLLVKASTNSDIINISFRHKDPRIAARFANAVAEAFVDRQIALYSTPGAADFFAAQKARFDKKFREASDALAKFAVATSVYSADDQRELLLRRRSDLALALATTRASIAQKTGSRQQIALELRKLAPVARSAYVASLVDNLGGVKDLKNYVPSAPDERSSDLLAKVYQQSMSDLFKVAAELVGDQNLESQETNELRAVTQELDTLEKNDQKYAELKREVNQATYDSDLSSRRMVEEQIAQESGKEKFSSVTVMQEAMAPIRPVFPNYLLGVLISGFLSLVLALGLILIIERVFVKKPSLFTGNGSRSDFTVGTTEARVKIGLATALVVASMMWPLTAK